MNTKAAFEIFISQSSMGNKDIGKIFERTSPGTIRKLKKPVLERMNEIGLTLTQERIDVGIAFDVWGIDIKNLEHKYSKIKKIQSVKGEKYEVW